MKVTHSPKCSQLHNTITASKRLVACPGLWCLYIMSWIPNKTLKSTEYTTKRRIIGRKFLFLHTVSHKLHILKFPQHVCPTYSEHFHHDLFGRYSFSLPSMQRCGLGILLVQWLEGQFASINPAEQVLYHLSGNGNKSETNLMM